MSTDQMVEFHTPNAIREKGMNALIRELGVIGMVQFIRQFDPGKGDYTKERESLLADITMDDVERYLLAHDSSKG